MPEKGCNHNGTYVQNWPQNRPKNVQKYVQKSIRKISRKKVEKWRKKGDDNEEKSMGKGGKGGSRMESSSRKTRILQMGKVQGRVHPKLKHIPTKANTPAGACGPRANFWTVFSSFWPPCLITFWKVFLRFYTPFSRPIFEEFLYRNSSFFDLLLFRRTLADPYSTRGFICFPYIHLFRKTWFFMKSNSENL